MFHTHDPPCADSARAEYVTLVLAQDELLLTHLTQLADHMFEDVARCIIEERLQPWQVCALLQDALQSLLTLGRVT